MCRERHQREKKWGHHRCIVCQDYLGVCSETPGYSAEDSQSFDCEGSRGSQIGVETDPAIAYIEFEKYCEVYTCLSQDKAA
jgi:hypothetical protein